MTAAEARRGGSSLAPSGGEPLLRLERISKTFPGQRALTDVSLTVDRRGEIRGLVGQNGSGKSTLIKIVSGFHQPDPGGEVWIRGERMRTGDPAAAARHGLRFVHQGLGLIDELDAVDNMALTHGFHRRGLGRLHREEQARQLQASLDRIRVSTDLWRPVGQLPAIERTAIAVARAIEGVQESGGLLVLDEPTAALTPLEVRHLFEILRELKGSGVSVLYVSHRLQEIFEIADRVTVLRAGRAVATEPVRALDRSSLVGLMVGEHAPSGAGKESAAATSRPTPRVLRVRDLSVGSLRGLSFDLRAGEILGVAGFLGSGRDELPQALVGAVKDVSGEVAVGDEEPRRFTPSTAKRAGIALVPADRHRQGAVMPFSVRENMTLAGLPSFRGRFGLSRSAETDATVDWIGRVDVVPPDPARPFNVLSGGNQQKVVLAKWLMVRPRVMVVDEPTIGVDVSARARIYDLIRRQAADGLGFIVCSSDIQELAEVAHRVLVLHLDDEVSEVGGDGLTEGGLLQELMRIPAPSRAGLA